MKIKQEPYDLTKYSIQFSSIFEFKEIQTSFYKFLISEFNNEPMDCINEINLLKTLKTDKEIISKCKSIIEDFFQDSSKKEVNVSGFSKIDLFTKMNEQLQQETWILKETAYDVFLPMKILLLNELQIDTFPRYIRTKSCSRVMASFVDNPKVMILLSSSKYRLSDKDFEKPFISKNEMDFMKEISKESFAWDLIQSKKEMMLYTSSFPFLPDCKSFKNSKSIKIESMLPYSFEKVVSFFLSIENMMEMDKNLVGIHFNKKQWTKDLVKKYPNEDIKNPFYFIDGESLRKRFPFKIPRKTMAVYNIEFDEEKETLSFFGRPNFSSFEGRDLDCSKKMNFETFGKDNQNVKGYFMNIMDMIEIQIIDPYTTRISYLRSIN
jgi:hypothetical protein